MNQVRYCIPKPKFSRLVIGQCLFLNKGKVPPFLDHIIVTRKIGFQSFSFKQKRLTVFKKFFGRLFLAIWKIYGQFYPSTLY